MVKTISGIIRKEKKEGFKNFLKANYIFSNDVIESENLRELEQRIFWERLEELVINRYNYQY